MMLSWSYTIYTTTFALLVEYICIFLQTNDYTNCYHIYLKEKSMTIKIKLGEIQFVFPDLNAFILALIMIQLIIN